MSGPRYYPITKPLGDVKKAQRDKIERDTAEYLAKAGEIVESTPLPDVPPKIWPARAWSNDL